MSNYLDGEFLFSEEEWEDLNEDQEYYDPCDHACECDLENGCSECNPEELPTYC